MKHYLTVVFLLAAVASQAQDSLSSLSSRLQEDNRLSEHFSFVDEEYLTAKIFRQSYSLTQVSISGNYHAESQPILLQSGKNKWGGAFNASSYQLLKPQIRLWGEAMYKNGVKEDVLWNESSDLEIIYPYISADSIGGNINSETYFFRGGYAQERNKWIWAAEVQYRALLEHRKVDPRPKNTVADFQVKLGVGRNVFSDYVLMLSASTRRYKQRGSLQYYSVQGNGRTYHLTGLGMDYVRFSGTNNSVSYKGLAGGALLSLLPKSKSGYHFSVDYDYFSLEKILVDLNSLPMSHLKTHQINLFFAWTDGNASSKWGIKTFGKILLQNGTENVFGDPTNNVYLQISSSDMYQCDKYSAELAGFYEWGKQEKLVCYLQPKVSYANSMEKYVYPEREVAAKHIIPALDFNISLPLRKTMLSLIIHGEYALNIDKHTLLTDLAPTDQTYNLTMNIIDFRQSDYLTTHINLRCDIAFGDKLLFFLQGGWQYYHYKTSNAKVQSVRLAFGIVL